MMPKNYRNSRGFTYPLVLILIGVTSITSLVTYQHTSTLIQRENEAELLFIGEQYVRAIESYYKAGNRKQLPSKIEDLLQDNRYVTQKHLRKQYLDPMINPQAINRQFDLIKAQNGKIVGVASRSTRAPIKQSNFPVKFDSFQGASTYNDWKFVFSPTPELNTPTKNRIRK